MILVVNNKECAALTIHMAIMRGSFRNVIKKRYKADKDDFLGAYDYIQNESKKLLEAAAELSEINLNIRDLNILEQFLKVYIAKLGDLIATESMKEINREQLEVLMDLRQKCKELMEQ